jgi:hypothetical protein
VGLVLAGGILLLWVSWKVFRELRLSTEGNDDAVEPTANIDINTDGVIAGHTPRKSFSGRKSDRCSERIHVPRQRAGRCWCRARAFHCSNHWAWLVGCPYGHRGELYRAAAAQTSMDRPCGIALDPVCRRRDDLPGD